MNIRDFFNRLITDILRDNLVEEINYNDPQDNNFLTYIVGHNWKDQGAIMTYGVSEWGYFDQIGELIYQKTGRSVLQRQPRDSYTFEVNEMVSSMKRMGVNIAIELHFNAHTSPAAGREFLILNKDDTARKLCSKLNHHLKEKIPKQAYRGVKEVLPKERGYYFLKRCNEVGITGIIYEAFFGGFNTSEEAMFFNHGQEILSDILINFQREVEAGFVEKYKN